MDNVYLGFTGELNHPEVEEAVELHGDVRDIKAGHRLSVPQHIVPHEANQGEGQVTGLLGAKFHYVFLIQ